MKVLEDPNRRGKPLGRWKDRLEEYLGESGINGRTSKVGVFGYGDMETYVMASP